VRKQRNGIALDRQSGEAIGDDDGEVARAGLKLRNGVVVERPAKNRLAKIGSTVGGVGLERKDRKRCFSKNGEFGAEALREGVKVKHSVYRVARLSVRELEIEHFTRGNAMARRRQRYSGRSETAEVETASWDERRHGLGQFSEGGCI
jgi:hypothetical protein